MRIGKKGQKQKSRHRSRRRRNVQDQDDMTSRKSSNKIARLSRRPQLSLI